MFFEQPIVRFGVSGTLIGLYGLAEHLARRQRVDPLRSPVGTPVSVTVLVFASILGFYAAIRPLGGAIAGGNGNLAGIALALLAMALRVRLGGQPTPWLRMPDVAVRLVFYVALPLAVGVPWGWAILTLPAIASSVWCCVREDRLLLERHGEAWRARMAATRRLVPGIW